MRRSVLVVVAAVVVAVVLTATVIVVVLLNRSSPTPDDEPEASSPPVALPGTVKTASGQVRGVGYDGVRAWLGLPYAAPPTGPLRWQAPQPAKPWTGVRDASTFGASCVQADSYTFGDKNLTQRASTSEDCLFVNVVRPDDDSRNLPVIVWLHGGAFLAGTGASGTAAATELVRRGVVVVSVNYRLGRLGFFAHPALRGGVANFGLLDQVAALEWVSDNARAFGGNAENVTVMGSSAGAMSVNALMSSPRAAGLFDRAISQSAPGDSRSLTLAEARQRGASAFPGLTPDELRAMPAERLLSSTFNTLAGDAPILDAVLPESSARAFAEGREAAVPYLVGTTADELDDDGYAGFGVDPDDLRDALGGAKHDALVAAYGDGYETDVLDDLVFNLPSVETAVSHARRAPTYRYVFSGTDFSGHGAEGAYVFDTISAGPDAALSDAVADYWVAFARTGRPAAIGLPAWPAATGDGSAYLSLEPGGPTAHAEDPRLPRLAALRVALS